MAQKTKLNKGSRETIYNWMVAKILDNCPQKQAYIDSILSTIELANKIIRKKYPEKEMVVLRKYNLTRFDMCLKFSLQETGRVFGFDIPYNIGEIRFHEDAQKVLADVPFNGGCRSSEMFEGNQEIADAVELYNKNGEALKDVYRKKKNEYYSFVENCKYLEDIETIVPLPAEFRARFTGTRNALVAINPEVITTIENDFKAA